jgi:rhodanese-related sulfurtransferase
MVHQRDPKRLTISIVIFTIIIIVGLITISRPKYVFTLDAQATLETILAEQEEITPYETAKIVARKDQHYQLIDLRSPYDFLIGHIDDAINIPLNSILEDENFAIIKKFSESGKTTIFYGNGQSQANGPWLLMTQLGIKNIKVLAGGYEYFIFRNDSNFIAVDSGSYAEKAKYDYAQVFQEISGDNNVSSTVEKQPQKMIPKRGKKKIVAAGGC